MTTGGLLLFLCAVRALPGGLFIETAALSAAACPGDGLAALPEGAVSVASVEAACGAGAAAAGVLVKGIVGGTMWAGLAVSGALAFQGSGVGNRERLAHSKGSPPATIAIMIRGQAAVRVFSLAVAADSALAFPPLPAAASAVSEASFATGKAWPQCAHLAAPTSLIFPHSGLGQIVRCIEQPQLEQKRVPDLF